MLRLVLFRGRADISSLTVASRKSEIHFAAACRLRNPQLTVIIMASPISAISRPWRASRKFAQGRSRKAWSRKAWPSSREKVPGTCKIFHPGNEPEQLAGLKKHLIPRRHLKGPEKL